MFNRRGGGFSDNEIPRPAFGDELGSSKARREPRVAGLRLRDGTTIEGTIHVPPYSRPMDLLNNRDEVYLAVTDARVVDPSGDPWETPFVALNRADIVLLYEVRTLSSMQKAS